MGSYDLTRKLTRGIYTALTAGALGFASLSGCDKYPIDPPPTEPNNHPLSSLSVSPTSGISPLETRVKGSCTDVDGDLKDYKVMSGGSIITRTNPIDTLVTLTQDASFNSYCEDARGNISSSGPVNVSVTQPPQIPEQIAFRMRIEGNDDIYFGNLENNVLANLRRLTTDPRQDLLPSWSPDGEYIAWTTNRDGLNSIYVMKKDGTNKRKLTPPINTDFLNSSWSPDGTQISFAFIDRTLSTNGLSKINSDGSGLITKLIENPGIGSYPAGLYWSKDGRIFYSDIMNGNSEIFSMNPDGTNKRRLTNTSYHEELPSVSPLGNRVAFVSTQFGGGFSGLEVMSMTVDGTDLKRITTGSGVAVDPTFSNDGKKIIFAFDAPLLYSPRLHLINSDGTGEWIKINSAGDVRYPAFRPR